MRKPILSRYTMDVNNDIKVVRSIEEEIRIAETSDQPIEGGSPIIYTDRKDGVLAEYNIRTDRFLLAQRAMDKVSASYKAKRMEVLKARTEANDPEDKN